MAEKDGRGFRFKAFGKDCELRPDGVFCSSKAVTDPRAVLITLYALHANPEPLILEPFRSFKELPGTMPYHGAFHANSERILIPHVPGVQEKKDSVVERLQGHPVRNGGGDLSFVVYPLPKIALRYVCYLPDEEFSASVSCLLSSNALSFMPIDGLADVAEYTARAIIEIVTS